MNSAFQNVGKGLGSVGGGLGTAFGAVGEGLTEGMGAVASDRPAAESDAVDEAESSKGLFGSIRVGLENSWSQLGEKAAGWRSEGASKLGLRNEAAGNLAE